MAFRVKCKAHGCILDAFVKTIESAELLAFAHEQRRASEPSRAHIVDVIPLQETAPGDPKGGPR